MKTFCFAQFDDLFGHLYDKNRGGTVRKLISPLSFAFEKQIHGKNEVPSSNSERFFSFSMFPLSISN